MIELRGPRSPCIQAGDAWRAGAAHSVLWIVVIEPVDVESKHQGLAGRELLVEASVNEGLAIVPRIVEVAIRGKQESGQRAREEGRSILPRVVAGDKEECL